MKKTVPKSGKNHTFEAGLFNSMRTKQGHIQHGQYGKRGASDIISGDFVG